VRPAERHVAYRMDWAPVGKLVLATIALVAGLVFGTQIELLVHADHAPRQLYVAIVAGVVGFYVFKSILEAVQAFANVPGHPPKQRHEVVYASAFPARFARSWRLIVSFVVVLACLSPTVYAWPDIRNVALAVSDYVRKNHPLEEPKKHAPQRPKVVPDKPFLDDPLGWLSRNTKPSPGPTESWPPSAP
jgi:hypothetical protein